MIPSARLAGSFSSKHEIWSAVTCYRFHRSRLVANDLAKARHLDAASQSGDKSPHSKPIPACLRRVGFVD